MIGNSPMRDTLIDWLAVRINRYQDHVMTYLREENRILNAKLRGGGLPLTDTERRRLAVLAHSIDRKLIAFHLTFFDHPHQH
jgi:hypothetical protein